MVWILGNRSKFGDCLTMWHPYIAEISMNLKVFIYSVCDLDCFMDTVILDLVKFVVVFMSSSSIL